MTTPTLLAALVAMSFCGAIVPIGPLEAYLVLAVSSNHLGWFAASAAAAAAAVGQVSGKLTVFQLARRSTKRSSRLMSWLTSIRPARRLLSCDAEHPRALIGLVVISSLIGLPPYAVVTPLAGTGGIGRRTFFLCSLAGRLTRFTVIAVSTAV